MALPEALTHQHTQLSVNASAAPVQRRIRVNGIDLNVEVAGAGSPVLLIHGFPDSLSQWREVAPRLRGSGYKTIAFDVRGFGLSDAPQGREHYQIGRLLADIGALLDALGETAPVHVIGHDWGAVIAWCFALRHPERVRSLVALSVGHPQAYARAGLMQKLKGWYTVAFQLPRVPEYLLLRKGGAGMRWWAPEHPVIDDVVADMSRPGRMTACINLYRANLIAILLRPWPRCKVPVLGIWSKGDKFLSQDQMTDSARLCDAGFEYRQLDGCAHWIPLEQPEWLAQQAAGWLARH